MALSKGRLSSTYMLSYIAFGALGKGRLMMMMVVMMMMMMMMVMVMKKMMRYMQQLQQQLQKQLQQQKHLCLTNIIFGPCITVRTWLPQ